MKKYRDMQAELDALINWFESDDIDLDQAMVKYEQAQKLLHEMEDYLQKSEIKINKITPDLKSS